VKVIIYIILVFSLSINAQSYRSLKSTFYPNSENLVTISKNASVNQAIEILSRISKQVINKVIILEQEILTPVGLEITNLNWYKALEIISRLHNLDMIEREDFIKLVPQKFGEQDLPDILKGVDFTTREVTISAVFFELDVNKAKERGINWRALFSKGGVDGVVQLGDVSTNVFNPDFKNIDESFIIGGKSQISTLGAAINATAIFNMLESDQVGEIIASPQITVKDKVKGEIQVGADFSTREKDFAGNTIERFYSTGTIIRVTPYILQENGKYYILLDVNVERSSAIPGQLTTEIKRTKASTHVLLLDGEETVIGGLIINEEKIQREGIPFLKDLPWWFFGIRYLMGRDVVVTARKELIIALKAKLNPSLYERMVKIDQEPIQNQLNNFDKKLDNIKKQIK